MKSRTLHTITRVGLLLFLLLSITQTLHAQTDFINSPALVNTPVNTQFTVLVSVQTPSGNSSSNVYGASIDMSFDTDFLEVVSVTSAAGNLLTQNLPSATKPLFDNNNGTIFYAAGSFGVTVDPNFPFVEIVFNSKQNTPLTNIDYILGVVDTDIIDGSFQSILGATPSIPVTIGDANTPPTFLTDITNQTNNELDEVSLSAAATDDEGNTITYTQTGLPLGLGIDPNTGLISGTIDSGAASGGQGNLGIYAVEIVATDDGVPNESASQIFQWTVQEEVVIVDYTITASAVGNGTVNPTSATVSSGGSETFTITPDPGFEVESVVVGSTDVTADLVASGNAFTYELTNVQSSTSLSATFSEIAPFQLCIASGSAALTAFGRTFEQDNANTGATAHPTRTGGKKYAGYNGAISGTADAGELLLFQKEMYGGKDANNPPIFYDIPVSPGYYKVELYFAEVFHPADGGRIFDVLLEDKLILDEYDLVNPIKDGLNVNQTAITRTYYVQVSDGSLGIQVGPATTDNGKLSGLCVTAVPNANVHPITNIGALSFDALTAVAQTLNITDADNDTFSISFNGMPASLTYNESNNQLEGTPTIAEVGTYTINAIISDGTNSPVTEEFIVTINPPVGNDSPTIEPILDIEVAEGGTATTSIQVNDDTDPSATIVLYDKSEFGTNNPIIPGLVIPNTDYSFVDNGSGSYSFTWNTTDGSGRSYLAQVTADDTVNEPVVEYFNINVAQPISETLTTTILARTFNKPLPWYGGNPPGAAGADFAVAIENTPAKNIGWIDSGDYVDYLIDVQSAGAYEVSIFAGNNSGGTTTVSILEDDGSGNFNSLGSVEVLDNNDWQAYPEYSTSIVLANTGLRTIRLSFTGGSNVSQMVLSRIVGNELPIVTIEGPALKTVAEQGTLQVPISVGDIDGDDLTVTITSVSNEPELLQTTNNPANPQADPFPIDASGFISIDESADGTGGTYAANLDFTPIFGDGGGANGDLSAVYTVTIEVSDGTATIADSFDITVTDVHQFISNDAVTRIEAESFDNQGPANTNTGGTGGTDGIGVEVNPTLTNIGFTHANDYAEYLIDVEEEGTYEFTFRVAKDNGAPATMTVNGGPSIVVSPTGGWQTFTDVIVEVDLLAGQQTLRLDWTTGGGFLFNVDYFDISLLASDNPPVVTILTPTTNGTPVSIARRTTIDFSAIVEDDEDDNTDLTNALEWSIIPNEPNFAGSGASFSDILFVPGEYTITATSTDGGGNTASDNIAVTILGPVVEFTVPGNNDVLTSTDVRVDWTAQYMFLETADNEHFHLYVNPTDPNDFTTGFRISTKDFPNQLFWDLNADDHGIVEGENTVVIVAAESGHEEFTNPEAMDTVTFTVALPRTVPDVVGNTQANAIIAIEAADLTAVVIDEINSVTVPLGSVISQDPVGGSSVDAGSSVNLVVSLGPVQVGVPNVVSSTQVDATTAIVDAGLVVGTVIAVNDPFTPSGTVISQDPMAGITVDAGSAVNLVVSSGIAQVGVPNVVGTAQAAAESTIVSANLVVGDVTQENSDTVAVGDVISQNPVGGSMVDEGSQVNLVISSGISQVSVPDVVSTDQGAAESAIISAGLVIGDVTEENSDTVAVGDVISQDPVGGSMVDEGSQVNLVISSGIAQVSVPDVVSTAQVAAESAIISAGLVIGDVTEESSNTVAVGDVISQNPVGGSMVNEGSRVSLVISSGVLEVNVPNVVGTSQADAESAITLAGLVVGDVTEVNSDTVAAGDVISQDPVGGSSADEGSAVNLVVSLGDVQVGIGELIVLDATDDTPLFDLVDGMVIKKSDIGNTPLGIIYNTDFNPNGVFFTLTGPINESRNEGPAPHSLFGDIGVNIQGKPFPVGEYTLVANPNSGPTLTVNFEVTDVDPLCEDFDIIITDVSDPASCGDVGSATVMTTGGQAPYSYLWDNGSTTSTATDLVAGTRSVAVTDANGCTVSKTVTLSEPSGPNVTLANFANILNTAAPIALTQGAPSGGEYSGVGVNSANGTFDPSGLLGPIAITYTVTEDGCTNSVTKNIVVITNTGNSQLTVLDATDDTPLFDLVDGMVIKKSDIGNTPLGIIYNTDFNPNGVFFTLTGPINESRNEGPAPHSLFGDIGVNIQGKPFPVGEYTLVANPNSGPTLTVNFEVTDVDPLCEDFDIIITDVSDPASCGDVGSATVMTTGGQAPYSYLWDNGSTTSTATDLVAGTRSVAVTDANGCTVSKTVTLSEPSGPNVTLANFANILNTAAPIALTQGAPSGGEYSGVGVNSANGTFDPSGLLGPIAITYTVTEDGCTNSVTKNIVVTAVNNTLSVVSFTLVNAETDEDILTLTSGMVISYADLPTNKLNIRANTTNDVSSVSMVLTGAQAVSRVESVAPYALFGDFPAGDYNVNEFIAGNYVISATAYSLSGAGGSSGTPLTIGFEFRDVAASAKGVKEMIISPNPVDRIANIVFQKPKMVSTIYVYDTMGRLAKVFSGNPSEEVSIQQIPVQDLPSGTYFVRTIDVNGNELQQQMAIRR